METEQAGEPCNRFANLLFGFLGSLAFNRFQIDMN